MMGVHQAVVRSIVMERNEACALRIGPAFAAAPGSLRGKPRAAIVRIIGDYAKIWHISLSFELRPAKKRDTLMSRTTDIDVDMPIAGVLMLMLVLPLASTTTGRPR
ncbi:hypothetical protein ACTGJ9_037760 [Bradyrhizobium sp. RDM12]